ncbi:hypothetical protein J6590_063041 [Homalodisca vitripennis]|nr:hypothetical protein J6590_063041 [Homalodisca vitripennis]
MDRTSFDKLTTLTLARRLVANYSDLLRPHQQSSMDNAALWVQRLTAPLPAPQQISQETTPRDVPIVGDPFSNIALDLVFPKGKAMFILNGKKLQLLTPLDRDQDNLSHIVFQLTCTVKSSNKKRTIPVIVRVSDVNDNTPMFVHEPYETTVSEARARGAQVTVFNCEDLVTGRYRPDDLPRPIYAGWSDLLADITTAQNHPTVVKAMQSEIPCHRYEEPRCDIDYTRFLLLSLLHQELCECDVPQLRTTPQWLKRCNRRSPVIDSRSRGATCVEIITRSDYTRFLLLNHKSQCGDLEIHEERCLNKNQNFETAHA